jgi:hypothetical protein
MSKSFLVCEAVVVRGVVALEEMKLKRNIALITSHIYLHRIDDQSTLSLYHHV